MERKRAGWPVDERITLTFRHRALTGSSHRPQVKSEGSAFKGPYKSLDEALASLASNSTASVFSRPVSKGLYEAKRQASRLHGPIGRFVELLCEGEQPRSPLLVQPHMRLAKAASLCLKEDKGSAEEVREERISVKLAIRDREWLKRNKEMIVGDFQRQLLWSFGLALELPPDPHSCFKVYIAPGNNSQLVKKTFASRWWWTRTEDKSSANLLWTQWKDRIWLISLSRVLSASYKRLGGSSEAEGQVRYSPYPQSAQLGAIGKLVDLTPLANDLVVKSLSFTRVEPVTKVRSFTLRTHNKLEGNHQLINKKALFLNMRNYYQLMGQDPFCVLPLTFFVKGGEDEEMRRMEEKHAEMEREGGKPVWIVKPGENTNRGTGIALCRTVQQIKEEMRAGLVVDPRRTFIIQHYISHPFLVHRRKFDIRLYALLTSANGVLQAYYYTEGYLRTSSKEFSMANISNKLVHLTNDAVQKLAEDYGKFEVGNKLAYTDFQRYLDTHCKDKHLSFQRDVLPKLRSIVKDTVQAVYLKLDPKHRAHSFEILGYDFLLDDTLNPWLIEVNTNPCLELSSPLLARIIPSMLDNALK